MRAQLSHLVERAALPNVEIRVIPFAAGAHTSLSSGFDVLRFRDEPDVVYIETRGGIMYLESADRFTDALRELRAVALSAQDSVAMIAAIADGETT
jgi:hypothetical protein